MAFRDVSAAGKRKLDNGKEKTSKRPKFEKRPQSKPQDDSDDISDLADPEEFSDDPEDGGAPLKGNKLQRGEKKNDQPRQYNGQAGQGFERGRPLKPFASEHR
jgi:hypothetical protein